MVVELFLSDKKPDHILAILAARAFRNFVPGTGGQGRGYVTPFLKI